MTSNTNQYSTGRLKVSDLHELHYEQWGNPDGIPVVYLHGGPGEGCHARQTRFFDLKRYRVVLLDQRGCGRSTPHACVEQNTTADLVADLEQLRSHLSISKWLVFGGSWGSTLALSYAQANPSAVSGMVLWGIFFGSRDEIQWYYQFGARHLFPEAWSALASVLTSEECTDVVSAFHRILNAGDEERRTKAAVAWSQWEATTMNLRADPARIANFGEAQFAIAFARLETHYFVNESFMRPKALLDGVPLLHGIPARIIHGRYDVVTPISSAIELQRAWPQAHLEIIPDAGHSSTESGIEAALMLAAAQFTGSQFEPA